MEEDVEVVLTKKGRVDEGEVEEAKSIENEAGLPGQLCDTQ